MRALLNELIERNSRTFSIGTLIISIGILIICVGFFLALWRLPDELRGGMESWGLRLAVNDKKILNDYAKIIERMNKIEDNLLYLEVYLFEQEINKRLDADQRNIVDKLRKIESDRQRRLLDGSQ